MTGRDALTPRAEGDRRFTTGLAVRLHDFDPAANVACIAEPSRIFLHFGQGSRTKHLCSGDSWSGDSWHDQRRTGRRTAIGHRSCSSMLRSTRDSSPACGHTGDGTLFSAHPRM